MAMDGIRGYLQLASGLVEMSRAKAMEAAAAVLALPGTVADSMGGSSGPGGMPGMPAQVQDLAEELMAAAAANRRSLVALIRSEVESALGKAVVVPADELDRARAAVAKLSADVEELRDQVMASPAVRSIPEPGRSALTAVTDVVSEAMSGAASSVLARGASLTRPAGSAESAGSAGSVSAPLVSTPSGSGASSGSRPSRSAVKAAASTSSPVKKAARKATTKKASARPSASASRGSADSASTRVPSKAAKTITRKAATTTTSGTPTPAKRATTTKATKKTATKKTATKKTSASKKAATPTGGGGAG